MADDFLIQRPKSFRGLSARELMSAERTDDTGTPLPPATLGGDPASADLAFYARAGFARRFVAQPSAATDYFGHHRPPFPTAWANRVRLVCGVKVAGAAGAYARLLYSTSGAPGTWANPGIGGAAVTVAIDAASADGDIKGVGLPLRAEARADVWWMCELVGGDGATSPELARLSAQFYTAPGYVTERLYWRPGAAILIPTTDTLIDTGGVTTAQGLGSGCAPCPPGAATVFLSTSPADPLGGPLQLLHTKGNGSAALAGNTNSAHTDWIGHVGRFVSPGLVGGQRWPEGVVIVGGAGQLASADPDGGGIGYGVGIYRPSTGTWIRFGTKDGYPPGFRYSPRGRVFQIPLRSFVTADDDRIVLDVALSIKVGCGCATSAHDLPAWALYNGTNDSFADDADLSGSTVASYVEVPKMRYLNEIP